MAKIKANEKKMNSNSQIWISGPRLDFGRYIAVWGQFPETRPPFPIRRPPIRCIIGDFCGIIRAETGCRPPQNLNPT